VQLSLTDELLCCLQGKGQATQKLVSKPQLHSLSNTHTHTHTHTYTHTHLQGEGQAVQGPIIRAPPHEDLPCKFSYVCVCVCTHHCPVHGSSVLNKLGAQSWHACVCVCVCVRACVCASVCNVAETFSSGFRPFYIFADFHAS
jgi:hypothetical protein